MRSAGDDKDRVLGGTEPASASERTSGSEPLATVRSQRRIFLIWVPLCLLGGLLVGLALLQFGLQVALIGMLVVQTGGFFVTYLVAQNRRMDPLPAGSATQG